MKIRLVSLFIAFIAALFCAAALLAPAVAGADESNYSSIHAVVTSQHSAKDTQGFYWETEVLTKYGHILCYKETNQLWRGCPLTLDVYTPTNNPKNWVVCGAEKEITLEKTVVYLLIAIAVGIIGKNL